MSRAKCVGILAANLNAAFVEIRAAQIAAMWRDCIDDLPVMTFAEVCGWLDVVDASEGREFDAGYLARIIHDHDENQP